MAQTLKIDGNSASGKFTIAAGTLQVPKGSAISLGTLSFSNIYSTLGVSAIKSGSVSFDIAVTNSKLSASSKGTVYVDAISGGTGNKGSASVGCGKTSSMSIALTDIGNSLSIGLKGGYELSSDTGITTWMFNDKPYTSYKQAEADKKKAASATINKTLLYYIITYDNGEIQESSIPVDREYKSLVSIYKCTNTFDNFIIKDTFQNAQSRMQEHLNNIKNGAITSKATSGLVGSTLSISISNVKFTTSDYTKSQQQKDLTASISIPSTVKRSNKQITATFKVSGGSVDNKTHSNVYSSSSFYFINDKNKETSVGSTTTQTSGSIKIPITESMANDTEYAIKIVAKGSVKNATNTAKFKISEEAIDVTEQPVEQPAETPTYTPTYRPATIDAVKLEPNFLRYEKVAQKITISFSVSTGGRSGCTATASYGSTTSNSQAVSNGTNKIQMQITPNLSANATDEKIKIQVCSSAGDGIANNQTEITILKYDISKATINGIEFGEVTYTQDKTTNKKTYTIPTIELTIPPYISQTKAINLFTIKDDAVVKLEGSDKTIDAVNAASKFDKTNYGLMKQFYSQPNVVLDENTAFSGMPGAAGLFDISTAVDNKILLPVENAIEVQWRPEVTWINSLTPYNQRNLKLTYGVEKLGKSQITQLFEVNYDSQADRKVLNVSEEFNIKFKKPAETELSKISDIILTMYGTDSLIGGKHIQIGHPQNIAARCQKDGDGYILTTPLIVPQEMSMYSYLYIRLHFVNAYGAYIQNNADQSGDNWSDSYAEITQKIGCARLKPRVKHPYNSDEITSFNSHRNPFITFEVDKDWMDKVDDGQGHTADVAGIRYYINIKRRVPYLIQTWQELADSYHTWQRISELLWNRYINSNRHKYPSSDDDVNKSEWDSYSQQAWQSFLAVGDAKETTASFYVDFYKSKDGQWKRKDYDLSKAWIEHEWHPYMEYTWEDLSMAHQVKLQPNKNIYYFYDIGGDKAYFSFQLKDYGLWGDLLWTDEDNDPETQRKPNFNFIRHNSEYHISISSAFVNNNEEEITSPVTRGPAKDFVLINQRSETEDFFDPYSLDQRQDTLTRKILGQQKTSTQEALLDARTNIYGEVIHHNSWSVCTDNYQSFRQEAEYIFDETNDVMKYYTGAGTDDKYSAVGYTFTQLTRWYEECALRRNFLKFRDHGIQIQDRPHIEGGTKDLFDIYDVDKKHVQLLRKQINMASYSFKNKNSFYRSNNILNKQMYDFCKKIILDQ